MAQFILERYLHSAVLSIPNHFITSKNKSFRCNLCGDSKSNHSVRSAGLVYDKDHWYFKCFRSDCVANNAISGEKWLKLTNLNLHTQFVNELKRESRKDCYEGQIKTNKTVPEVREDDNKIKLKKQQLQEIEDMKWFKKLNGTELSQKAFAFLDSRLIDVEHRKNFYVAEGGTFKNRLIIPIFDEDEEIVFWQARTLVDSGQKYLNRIGNKAEHVWGLDRMKYNPDGHIVICEGIFSAMSIKRGVAILGSAISEQQAELIENYSNKIYCFDNDNAGKTAMKKLLKKGNTVLNWFQLIKQERLPKTISDLNDLKVYLGKEVTIEYLKPYLTDSWFDVEML